MSMPATISDLRAILIGLKAEEERLVKEIRERMRLYEAVISDLESQNGNGKSSRSGPGLADDEPAKFVFGAAQTGQRDRIRELVKKMGPAKPIEVTEALLKEGFGTDEPRNPFTNRVATDMSKLANVGEFIRDDDGRYRVNPNWKKK